MGEIKVDSGGVRSTMASFQSGVSALESKFDEIKAKTAAVKGSWEGDDADNLLSQIEQFDVLFEAVREKNKTYIDFMNSTAATYDEEDSQIGAAASDLSA